MASIYSSLRTISSSITSSSSSLSHTSLPLSRTIHHSSSLCFATSINYCKHTSKLHFALFSHLSVSASGHRRVAAACALPSSSTSAAASDIENQSSPESLEESAVDMAGQQALREAVRRLAEEDLEEAAEKYNLEEELFSEVHYAQVNAFTDRPFSGNPAAVCYLPYERHDQWLQLVAREFNLSETAFLIKRRGGKKRSLEKEVDHTASSPALLQLDETGKKLKEFSKKVMPDDNEFDLRWFTPKVEVDLCGHATLASAHLMFSTGIVEGETIVFHTKSGVLKARKISGYDEEPVEVNQEESTAEKKKYPSGRGVVELDFPLVIASECDVSETARVSNSLGDVEIVWCGKTSLGDYLVICMTC
ncbi:hypothetical protein O6H91_17G008900 [Diphasiastrum complanatum]|uniref:Uncharacterized protein n=1 Tax=Diphasiastrum complanatum TaxID=34168 RepID=A0ACC2B410_DIPCM|nr:hypothetical protein O6H91_17G008900 [Diphasiastrum complanatum]